MDAHGSIKYEDGDPKLPGIRMPIKHCNCEFFDEFTFDYGANEPVRFFEKNYKKALLGELSDWKLIKVAVSPHNLRLGFATELMSAPEYLDFNFDRVSEKHSTSTSANFYFDVVDASDNIVSSTTTVFSDSKKYKTTTITETRKDFYQKIDLPGKEIAKGIYAVPVRICR